MADPFAAKRTGKKRDTATSLEVDRIVRLPVVEAPPPEVVEAFCREEIQANYYDDGFRLFDAQVGAVLAWDIYGGLFAPIGVGWGKTLITLMIAERAFRRGEASKVLLSIPSQVYPQLTQTDIPWARKRVGLSIPFFLMAGRDKAGRKAVAGSDKKGCYVLPHSLLSARDSEEMLGLIQPDLVILDEAHAFKSRKAARTQRLLRYLAAHQPKLVALSGTITSKSIKDYWHLIAHSLGENCPLPIDGALAENWSFVLDATADPSEAQAGPITPLIDWARKHFPQQQIPAGLPGFRFAYKLRLGSCPGVVSTGDAEIGTSLVIENLPVPRFEAAEGFDELREFMQQIEDLWLTPNGDEIEWGMHKWKYLYELTTGGYYRLRWPTIEELTRGGKLNEDEAAAFLEGALAHHGAQQEYHRKLRRWIEYQGRPGLDTPFLVAGEMSLHGDRSVGEELFGLWKEMHALRFEGMPVRVSEEMRVCSYKIDHVVRWAQELKGGALVWFHHALAGRWAYEALEAAGLDVLFAPAESARAGSNAAIINPANAGRIVVASMGGHGTGKNLQHFQQQVFLQFPRKADLLEQTMGRTHRNGQLADELVVNTINTNEFDHLNMAAALVDALYIHQTTGARQKVIYAAHNPLPKMYPIDFLRERGFADVAQLDGMARAALEEKFGPLVAPGRG